MNTKKKRALFIDRDGTLVVEPPVDYQLDSLENLQFMPKVFRNMAYIREKLDFISIVHFPRRIFLPENPGQRCLSLISMGVMICRHLLS